MISCRLHPVLCMITFYDNDQGREGAFFPLPANINVSVSVKSRLAFLFSIARLRPREEKVLELHKGEESVSRTGEC